jgi:hypothetical protein
VHFKFCGNRQILKKIDMNNITGEELNTLNLFITIISFLPSLLSYLLTPCIRIILEKLTGFQLVEKFPHFMKREGPLPHSQMTTNCTYPVLVHVPHPTS